MNKDQELTKDEIQILSEIFHVIDEMLKSIDRCGGYIPDLERRDLYIIAEKLGIEYE